MAGPATGPRYAPFAEIRADAHRRFQPQELRFQLHVSAARSRSTHPLLAARPAVKFQRRACYPALTTGSRKAVSVECRHC